MSSSGGDSHGKRRKMDAGGAASAAVGQGPTQQLMSAMNQLLDQNRSMQKDIKSMSGEMKTMRGEMATMREDMKDDMKNLRDKCDAMEKSLQSIDSRFGDQIASRFDDVENSLKYHEMLLQNQKWEYSAPYPHAAVDSEEEEDFLDNIKNETCNMRYGKCDRGEVELDFFPGNLEYDEAFLPHFKEFFSALDYHQYSLRCLPKGTVSSLTIGGIELPSKSLLVMLSNALRSTHFKEIRLRDNRFGRDGIKFALDYMQNNPVLEEFRLRDNPIDHPDDVHRLCGIIKEHPSIKKIDLRSCDVDLNWFDMLCLVTTAGKSKLKSIHFNKNGIITGGSTFIADFLATNPILEDLELCENQLDDEDAESIAGALKLNTNLRYLDMYDNDDITDLGWSALSKAEFDSTSLNSAAESNHTCHIVRASSYNTRREDSKKTREKKVYTVLSSRNRECSNVQHLDAVPVEFLPNLLRSIQQYSEYYIGDNAPLRDDEDYVEALSVVYEVMRFWDKAISVYESLSSC